MITQFNPHKIHELKNWLVN